MEHVLVVDCQHTCTNTARILLPQDLNHLFEKKILLLDLRLAGEYVVHFNKF